MMYQGDIGFTRCYAFPMSRHSQLTFPARVLGDAIQKFFTDDGPVLSRGLAFTLLIYCMPLALLAVSAWSYTVATSESALSWVRRLSVAVLPQSREEFNVYLSSVVSNR